MALFRLIRCQIQRSLSVAQASSISFSHYTGIQKIAENVWLKVRHLSSFSGLADTKKYISGFEDLPELESADGNVQRIFHLANASQKEQRKAVENELIKKCQNSQERKIAKMTVSIQNLEDHLEKMRNKDKHNKVYLQWLKDQRAKKLKNLKLTNFERYVELIKQFNIDPLPSTFSKHAKYKFRRFKIGVEIKEKKSQAVRKMPSLKKTL